MRLLMVAPEQFPVPGGGSVEICMLSIAQKLAKQHQVTIVSRQKDGLKSISRIGSNIIIVRVPSGGAGRYMDSVLRFMKGRRYDLIQVDNRPQYAARIKAAFPHTPVSLFLHSLTFVPQTSAIASCLNKADLIIANSSSLKQMLSKRFPSRRHIIHTVHLGVDLSRFKPSAKKRSAMKKKLNAGRSFVILFVGRIIPRKGLPVLIQAVQKVRKQVNSAKLIVAGKGSRAYLVKMKNQARKLHVPAKFLGNVPHKKIHRVYSAADCFVCPSQEHEAFGLVNVEAMASGVPVIASNIGGIKEIIARGHSGYLVDRYQSADSFARYILSIAKNRSLGKRLGMNGRKIVKRKFSWDNTATRLSGIYRAKARY